MTSSSPVNAALTTLVQQIGFARDEAQMAELVRRLIMVVTTSWKEAVPIANSLESSLEKAFLRFNRSDLLAIPLAAVHALEMVRKQRASQSTASGEAKLRDLMRGRPIQIRAGLASAVTHIFGSEIHRHLSGLKQEDPPPPIALVKFAELAADLAQETEASDMMEFSTVASMLGMGVRVAAIHRDGERARSVFARLESLQGKTASRKIDSASGPALKALRPLEKKYGAQRENLAAMLAMHVAHHLMEAYNEGNEKEVQARAREIRALRNKHPDSLGVATARVMTFVADISSTDPDRLMQEIAEIQAKFPELAPDSESSG